MTDITEARDRLFTNAQTAITQFGDEFTFQDFLFRMMEDQKHAYIDLLKANYHRENPFDAAHQQIGKRLSELASDLGYEREVLAGRDENIFGNKTSKVIYRLK